MKILVGFDGSESAKAAVYRAQRHAAAFNGRLDVITVVVRHSMDQSEEIQKAEKALRTDFINPSRSSMQIAPVN